MFEDLFSPFRKLFYRSEEEKQALAETGQKLNEKMSQKKQEDKWKAYQKEMEKKYGKQSPSIGGGVTVANSGMGGFLGIGILIFLVALIFNK